MNGKMFVKLMGAVACIAAFATAEDAEAGRGHRRRCCEPCCYTAPVCCEPVCVSSCAPVCAPACETVASYDCCGRLVWRRAACCETIVSSTIVVPAASCCGIVAKESSSTVGIAQESPAQESLKMTSVAVAK
ncbi:MAG: hypothetical protein K8S94_12115 [Planctomycetia bacterium]|nr:hypothetical protein [Planctomycetia bacterium]